jgi:hypothetical protein
MENNLFMVCVSSFIGVFFVLTFLAVAMRLIIVVFPEKGEKHRDDTPLYAAISSSYSRLHPGYKISKIEEINK